MHVHAPLSGAPRPGDAGCVHVSSLARTHLEPVELRSGQILYHSGQLVDHLYFPMGAMVSLVAQLSDGASVEVGEGGGHGRGRKNGRTEEDDLRKGTTKITKGHKEERPGLSGFAHS